MTSSRQLFVVGPARSGTTYTMAQLNRSDDVFLLSELNVFQLAAGISPDSPIAPPGFAADFNKRKTREGNTRQKGSFIPQAENVQSVEGLFSSLSESYRIVGEKVALSSKPVAGRYPAEVFFDVHVDRFFHAHHLVILRDPADTLESLSVMFPDTPIHEHLIGLVHTFERLFELSWVLPRARIVFYERLGEKAFADIFAWLGLNWQTTSHLPFSPARRPDEAFRKATLRARLPALEKLEDLYRQLCESAGQAPLWARDEHRDFRSGKTYESLSSELRALRAAVHRAAAKDTAGRSPDRRPSAPSDLRVILETDHPLAADSVDHLHPLGTKQDNYHSPNFTRKLLALYADTTCAVLDLGCAGGGFVKEIIDHGHFAVGLEGSDYSLRHQRAEWPHIPDRLFTCDCTHPFSLYIETPDARRPARFHAITAWEFLEHIPEQRLPVLLENIKRHLDPDYGLFIASIHLHPCLVGGVEYHATVKPEWWWRSLFLDHGFFPVDRALDYFDDDWVRGASPEQNAYGSCHVVLTLNPSGPIVRRIDRLAPQEFEHARLGRAELKQLLIEAKQRETALNEQIKQLEAAKADASARGPGFSPAALATLTAHAIERCRLLGVRKVAIYGAGSHTRHLLPIWRALHGPPVERILVSNAAENECEGIPVVPVGSDLPDGVDAIVPSSHAFEPEMRRICRNTYPQAQWIFLWHPPEETMPPRTS